jgi:hypothetical protein
MKDLQSGRLIFLENMALEASANGGDYKAAMTALRSSQMRIIDHVAYTTIDLGGVTYKKVFENTDKKETGLRNVAEGKLDANRPMVVTHIRMTAVNLGAAATPDLIKAANFASIDNIPILKNSELTWKINNKILLDETATTRFSTPADAEVGLVKLSDAVVIVADREIQFEFESGIAVPANTIVKFEFIGYVAISVN